MPVYVYQCDNCGYRFEQYQKFTDMPLKMCPKCKKLALNRVCQPAAVVFKGDGFYINDSRQPKDK
jgi:putative FmdB family regulatory protein